MSSILHLMRELHLDIPQDPEDEPKTFLEYLTQFYVATITGNHQIVNSFPAIQLFIQEYLGGELELMNQQQPCELVFLGIKGDSTKDGYPGCHQLNFMVASYCDETILPDCGKCGEHGSTFMSTPDVDCPFIIPLPDVDLRIHTSPGLTSFTSGSSAKHL